MLAGFRQLTSVAGIGLVFIYVFHKMAENLSAAGGVSSHSVAQPHPTQTHIALLVAYALTVAVWIVQQLGSKFGIKILNFRSSPSDSTLEKVEEGTGQKEGEKKQNDVTIPAVKPPPPGPPPVSFESMVTSCVLFGAIMIYFYMCDYAKVFPQAERHYERDLFLFLVFLFFLVACAFTIKPNADKILNRDMTEEWKGWMQVMFVWYHYFAAKEWYNWIRVYIACYVWMTGFGNFSFFWVRGDFSLWRITKMMFRLNFLVAFVVMVTNNSYMLYYICAMHTYWFLTVYAFMRVLNSWNTDRRKMAVKFLAYFLANAAIFDLPGASSVVFRPLSFILGLDDGKGDLMHEWAFRAGLDHWACFAGMLCAYNYPHYEALMAYIDAPSSSAREVRRKLGIRVAMAAGAVLTGVVWYFTVMNKDKYAYNALHPYTSIIPILVFIVLRNIHPVLRRHHVFMFAWLGKITLETYLSQLHIYLLANARTLLVYLANFPLLNFALATAVYLTLSLNLFNITNDVSGFLLPKDMRKLAANLGGAAALAVVAACCSFLYTAL